EEEKFKETLERGSAEEISQLNKTGGQLTGDIAFNLYESHGLPLEISKEIALSKGFKINKNIDVYFSERLKKHQELSRKGAEQKFKGGLADHSEQTTKYHTATHLLLAALRKVLGDHVQQKGSNITAERLRFDFSHGVKLTKEELEQIEDLINQKIKQDLEVKCEEMPLEEARKQGATGVFGEKYGARVKVYTIGDPSAGSGQVFSKEICGGPHIKRTSELGRFIIVKEESPGAGSRRIRAILE
ncbi:MAG TPA: alanine--tRNA ligase-related protein, partial [Candidatus Lokiarchaeia archaeon]